MLDTVHAQHQLVTNLSLGENFKKENIGQDCVSACYDTVESPLLKRLTGELDESEESIFRKMKYECNRLYSFQNKWPIKSIKPEDLAEAGFFYLQHEDKVQCPFCGVIIYNWTYEDKPLREHMKKSPKCPFLMGHDVGNIRKFSENTQHISSKPVTVRQVSSHSVVSSFKPKHPRMADIKRRLLTYSDWPLHFLKPQTLAECGLYYTGVSDVVICFFCGGSLGNWETNDDPWEEHTKFFPDCAYLALAKKRHMKSSDVCNKLQLESLAGDFKTSNGLASTDVTSEIIRQAIDIFPEPLVMEAVKRKNKKISSLQDLCDDILELKQKSNSQFHSALPKNAVASSIIESSEANSDALLCKICMDRDRGVVFQPCGHLISCWNCAQLVKDCPVCRRPIINVIKTYFS